MICWGTNGLGQALLKLHPLVSNMPTSDFNESIRFKLCGIYAPSAPTPPPRFQHPFILNLIFCNYVGSNLTKVKYSVVA